MTSLIRDFKKHHHRIPPAGLCFILALALSCQKTPTQDQRLPASLGISDWNMSAAPNDLDIVGLIFAVDSDKKQYPITNLAIEPTAGVTTLRNYRESRTTRWGALANFLGLPTAQLTAQAGISDSTNVTTSIEFNTLTRQRANLLDIDPTLTAKLPEIKAFVKRWKLEKYQFYLIIETMKTDKLSYQFDQVTVGRVNLETAFKQVAATNGKVNWDKDKAFQLEFDLQKPLTVFYKVYQLEGISSLTGEVTFNLVKTPVVGSQGMLYTSRQNGR